LAGNETARPWDCRFQSEHIQYNEFRNNQCAAAPSAHRGCHDRSGSDPILQPMAQLGAHPRYLAGLLSVRLPDGRARATTGNCVTLPLEGERIDRLLGAEPSYQEIRPVVFVGAHRPLAGTQLKIAPPRICALVTVGPRKAGQLLENRERWIESVGRRKDLETVDREVQA
jgi:hypothetical protein